MKTARLPGSEVRGGMPFCRLRIEGVKVRTGSEDWEAVSGEARGTISSRVEFEEEFRIVEY